MQTHLLLIIWWVAVIQHCFMTANKYNGGFNSELFCKHVKSNHLVFHTDVFKMLFYYRWWSVVDFDTYTWNIICSIQYTFPISFMYKLHYSNTSQSILFKQSNIQVNFLDWLFLKKYYLYLWSVLFPNGRKIHF